MDKERHMNDEQGKHARAEQVLDSQAQGKRAQGRHVRAGRAQDNRAESVQASDRQAQQLQLCKDVRQQIVANLLKDGILEQTSNGAELQKLLIEEQKQTQQEYRLQEKHYGEHLTAIQPEQPQQEYKPRHSLQAPKEPSLKTEATPYQGVRQTQSASPEQDQTQTKTQTGPKTQVKQDKEPQKNQDKASPKKQKEQKEKDRNPVLELFFPMKDRGANVLVEPDEEAIAAGKGRHYAKTGQHKRNAFSLVLEAIVVILVVLLLSIPMRFFVLEYYYIPSGSMLETLQIDDHVLSEKISYYFSSPQRGDIITFNGTKNEEGKVLIKRVIGVGGDTIDLRRGNVYVNGEKLDEPYTLGKQTNPLMNSLNITYPYTVPDGELWVMGDNRSNSSDSRVFGSIPVKNVTGHAFWRYWPFNKVGLL